MLLIICTQLHTWASSMYTNCNIPQNDTPHDIKDDSILREKELQWNNERQRLETEIRLLKKEIDNASILFNREMKQSSASIADIFDKQNGTLSEQTSV